MKTGRRGFFAVIGGGIAAMFGVNANAKPKHRYRHPDMEDFISRIDKSGYNNLNFHEKCIAYWFYREGMNNNEN